uniref:Putative LOC100745028 [Bombus impatiens] n=1 Tax=Lepeophtheirus salmonis TaxID=72036 RepID=A0A0K2UM05_LEPSM
MKEVIVIVCVFCLLALQVAGGELLEKDIEGKSLSLFNVVRFENIVCTGDSKNGTCYTSEECEAKGGLAQGTCASGYGVCCIITLGCGGTSSENCTYIEQSSFTSSSSLSSNPCSYKICKLSDHVCRIRLDFTKHVLADPVSGTAVVGAVNVIDSRYAHGQCTEDRFTFSSIGKNGAPVICGYNTGQHMILDASEQCNVLSFTVGSSTAVSREWSIKVTQYNCGDLNAGPSGCLQYFTDDSGSFSTFNFRTDSATVSATATHLANQEYSICIRRTANKCRVCYSPHINDPAADADTLPQASYGISLSSNAASKSGADTDCTTDFIEIPGAVANTVTVPTTDGTNRICGRFFAAARDAVDSATVCSLQVPFQINVNFDENEELTAVTATMAQLSELSEAPSGTTGFWLDYFQVAC